MFEFIKRIYYNIFYGDVSPNEVKQRELLLEIQVKEKRLEEASARNIVVRQMEQQYRLQLESFSAEEFKSEEYPGYTPSVDGVAMPNYSQVWENETYRRDAIEFDYKQKLLWISDCELIVLANEMVGQPSNNERADAVRQELNWRVGFRRNLQYANEHFGSDNEWH